MHKPKGVKGTRRQLRQATKMTASAVKHAMIEASKAIDDLEQQLAAHRRVIVIERAKLIYMIENYEALIRRFHVLSVCAFAELAEDVKEGFVLQASKELFGLGDGPVAEAEPPRIIVN